MEPRQAWDIWQHDHGYGDLMRNRSLGKEPEMESAKQLLRLVSEVYEPGMSMLDVGCGAAHFWRSLRRLDEDIRYCGVDFTLSYLQIAQEVWHSRPACTFVCGDTFALPFPADSFDIVSSVTVLQNLPEYQTPVRELFQTARKVLFMRLLLSEITHVIKRYEYPLNKDKTGPEYVYYNIWNTDEFIDYVYSLGASRVDVIPDEVNITLERTHPTSTYTYGDLQLNGNIVMTWKWVRVAK
jgi:SAM-dependent methyltransferase